jgi:hypothetical protein
MRASISGALTAIKRVRSIVCGSFIARRLLVELALEPAADAPSNESQRERQPRFDAAYRRVAQASIAHPAGAVEICVLEPTREELQLRAAAIFGKHGQFFSAQCPF